MTVGLRWRWPFSKRNYALVLVVDVARKSAEKKKGNQVSGNRKHTVANGTPPDMWNQLASKKDGNSQRRGDGSRSF